METQNQVAFTLKADWVAVGKYFIGTVVDMGGTTAANVHFRIEDTDRQLVAESNEGYLRAQKENFLHRKVQLHVEAVENTKAGELKNIRLVSFVGIGPSYDEAELAATIEKGTKAWENVPDSAAWVRGLRGDEDEL